MTKKTFRYTIELSQPFFPRHVADMISLQGNIARALVSVTDLQNDQHWQGMTQSATYQVKDEQDIPDDSEPMTWLQMLTYYEELLSESRRTPERDAYIWILALLRQEGDGNMGLVTSYLKEFLMTIEAFQAHCKHNGKFVEAAK